MGKAVIYLLALFPMVVAAFLPISCAGKPESVRFGTSLLEPCIPIFIAEEQQYFAANGLDVSIKYYSSGLDQVNGMLKGEVDLCGPAAEYVMVGKAFQKEKVRIIGSIDQAESAFLVARKDRGIESIADLKGKKIAVVRGTIVEFYLGRCLELHGMHVNDVALVNMSTFSQSADAVVNGNVDACVALVPFVEDAQSELGEKGVAWSAQSGQAFYSLLICPGEWAAARPALIGRFLSAISRAEEFIIQHPEEAKAIAGRKLSTSREYMDRIWSRNRFSLSLAQPLIVAMEDEARWMIANSLTTEKKVPDFVDYIYADALKAVKPEAVNIIR
jgi:ABC-type nitrate/sulfonate/bicarbonate transport system substrate-binding protein